MSTAPQLPASHAPYVPRPFLPEAPPRPRASFASGLFGLLGRVLFAPIFLMAPITHFSGATIAFAAQRGVPDAAVLVPASGVLAFVGGFSILLGLWARAGALMIILFLVPVTLKMHAFWAESDPMMTGVQFAMFMKNVAMLGGAMMLLGFGAGPWSLDAMRRSSVRN